MIHEASGIGKKVLASGWHLRHAGLLFVLATTRRAVDGRDRSISVGRM
jgi:hypothetical protein